MRKLITLVLVLAAGVSLAASSATKPTTKPAHAQAIPKDCFSSRFEAFMRGQGKNIHYQGSEVADARKRFKSIDSAIQAYVSDHGVPDELAKFMFAGDIKPGMDLAAVKLYADLTLDEETESTQRLHGYVYDAWPNANPGGDFRLRVTNGKIVDVLRPD